MSRERELECVIADLTAEVKQIRGQRNELLCICEELQEAAEYWSEYFVPLGIVERLDAAIANTKDEFQDDDKHCCRECRHTWNAIDDTERAHDECPVCGSVPTKTDDKGGA